MEFLQYTGMAGFLVIPLAKNGHRAKQENALLKRGPTYQKI